MLVLLMMAASVVYPGNGIALLFLVPVIFYCAFECIFSFDGGLSREKIARLSYLFFTLLLLGIVAIGMAGALSRPVSPIGNMPQVVNWRELWQQLFEIRSVPGHSPFYRHWDGWIFGLSLLITLIAIGIGFVKRNTVTLSLTLGIPLFCVLLWCCGLNWIAFQSIGVPYPAILLGVVALYNQMTEEKNKRLCWVVLGILVLTVLIRVPKFLNSTARYTSHGVISTLQFSRLEMQTLAEKIGNNSVVVRVNDPMYAIPILVELGRQNQALQWAPETWRVILGYRPWASPELKKTPFTLTTWDRPIRSDCALVYRTRQYQLLGCSHKHRELMPPNFHNFQKRIVSQ